MNINIPSGIMTIVTDGPNVILKVAELVNKEHQVCFANSIL